MNGKQLKNSILQWAIQGKLVPQDPNDEPASVLLERIRAEKARLVKEGKIKKDKNESIIFRGDDNSHYEKFLATGEVKCIDDEIPFEIPQGWEWARIRDISRSYIGLTYSPADVSPNGPIVLRSSNIKDGKLHLDDIVRVKASVPEKLWVEKNDIIICARNGSKKLVGKSAIIPEVSEPMTFGAFMAICKTSLWKYVFCFLQSDLFFSQLREVSGTTTINQLTQNNFNGFLIPIPPYSEQERIFEQLNAILPLIETYSKQQENIDAINNSIRDRLKKSILQEAIKGGLLPQIAEEGTAENLLAEIRKEKQKLLKEGKLKKKDFTESVIFKGDDNKYYEKIGNETICIDEEIPFDIPHSWSWTRLGFLVSNETGLSYSKDCLSEKSSRMIRVLRGGNIEEGRWLTKDDDVMISASYVKDELILKRGTFITPAVTSIERMAKTALVEVDQSDIVVGGFVLMLKPFIKDDSLLHFLNLLFQSVYYKQYCIGITNKSGQAFYNLSRQKLMKCLIPIAPMKEMSRIAEKFASLNL